MIKNKLLILMIANVIFLSACVDKEKGKLDNRVYDFWKFKIESRFDKAYEFLSPGWRSNEPVESYSLRVSKSKVKWLEAKVDKKDCKQKDYCIVTVLIKYSFRPKHAKKAMIVESPVKENWLLKNNTWYLVPKQANK